MGVAFHFPGPFQEAPELFALPPGKFPKFKKADLVHLHAGIGFDSPQKVRAAPGSEVVSAGGVPQEAEHVAHGDIIQKSFTTETQRKPTAGKSKTIHRRDAERAEKTLGHLPRRSQRHTEATGQVREVGLCLRIW